MHLFRQNRIAAKLSIFVIPELAPNADSISWGRPVIDPELNCVVIMVRSEGVELETAQHFIWCSCNAIEKVNQNMYLHDVST